MGVGQEREKVFDSMAWWLQRHGVRPLHVTLLQGPVYAVMLYVGFRADTSAELWTFGWLQVLATVIDGADGILARRTGTVTRRGHLWDALFDIAGIGITLWVVAVLHPALAQWLLVLLLVNFFVYLQNEIQGTKSITYTRGPVTLGLVFEQYFVGVLLVGVALPIFVGTLLLFTRVAWRKRFWNYYQFLTAGRRQEYKAIPKAQRSDLAGHEPMLSPPMRPRVAPTQRSEATSERESSPRDP